MAHTIINGLWATSDGSYGSGEVVVVDTAKWSNEQWAWYEHHTMNGEVYSDQLVEIDQNIKPETFED